MSKTFILKLPKPKSRNPLVTGERGAGRQVFKDRRDKRAKDSRNNPVRQDWGE
jgi:hypothetical protein